MARLAIIVVSYNTAALLRECLTAIAAVSNPAETEVIVVDNASADDSVAMVRREFTHVRLVVLPVNAGFGAANNAGVAAATAPYIMLLNSDAILLADTGGGLVRYLQDNPAVSCVAPRILLPNGARQPRVFGNQPSLWRIFMQSLSLSAVFTGIPLLEGTDGRERPGRERSVGWVSGVCMVMRRADFLAVGGFDATIFMYCEDVDLCARLLRRGRIVRLDDLAVRHYGGASSPAPAAHLRNTVWVQRNMLKIVRGRSGPRSVLAAQALMSVGLLLRLAAGLVAMPRRGLRGNLLLQSSWLRLLDLVGARPEAR